MCPNLPLTVILSFFNKIIGPSTFHVHPPNSVSDNIIREIANSMDKISTPGFFSQSWGNIKTINRYFDLPSQWARGGKEEILVSFLLPCKSTPDLEQDLQPIAIEFEKKLIDLPDSYKGFYIYDEKLRSAEDRTTIECINKALVEQIKDLHLLATGVILGKWGELKVQELAEKALLSNPIFEFICNTGNGLKILGAIKQGAKTRQDLVTLYGLEQKQFQWLIPLFVELDILTEGIELVLTTRGHKILQKSSLHPLAEGSDSVNMAFYIAILDRAGACTWCKQDIRTYLILSAIHDGHCNLEDIRCVLKANSPLTSSHGVKSFIRFLKSEHFLEQTQELILSPLGRMFLRKFQTKFNFRVKTLKREMSAGLERHILRQEFKDAIKP